MKKTKTIYWVVTIVFAVFMLFTAIPDVISSPDAVVFITALGYPLYFLTLIGIWKLLGVVAILLPKLPLLKEWTYAGFFFSMTGALYSHIVSGSTMGEIFPPILLLVLTATSWYFRPADRKMFSTKTNLSLQS